MSSSFRKDSREDVKLLVRYRSPTEFDDFESECIDLSRSGAFIRSDDPPPRGTLLRVEWEVDGAPPVHAAARVVWCRDGGDGVEPGMGVKFTRVHGNGEEVLEGIVHAHRSKPRAAPRKRVAVQARYRAPTSFEFVDRECFDLSEGGMFIATTEPLAKGSLLKFECQLLGGAVQLAGVALVMWARGEPEGDQPPGMGVRFVRLAPGSTKRLRTILYGR